MYANENCELFNEQDQRWALISQEAILSSELPTGFQTWDYKATHLNHTDCQAGDIQVGWDRHLRPASEISIANHKHPASHHPLSTLKAKTHFPSSTYPYAILERSQGDIRKLNLCKTKNIPQNKLFLLPILNTIVQTIDSLIPLVILWKLKTKARWVQNKTKALYFHWTQKKSFE